MSITYVNSGGTNYAAGVDAQLTLDVGSSSDRILLVCALGDGSTNYPTGVTYNSVAMTDAGLYNRGTSFFDAYSIKLFYLVAPSTGSNLIQVTRGSSAGSGIYASSFAGVDQSTPYSNSGQQYFGSLTRYQDIVITVNEGGWAVGIWMSDGTATMQAGNANTTVRRTSNSGCIADRGQVTSPAGNETLSAGNTTTATSWFGGIWLALNPAGASGATVVPPSQLPILGAG